MVSVAHLVLGACLAARSVVCGQTSGDATTLIQAAGHGQRVAVKEGVSWPWDSLSLSRRIVPNRPRASAPPVVVNTTDGAILGVRERGYITFRGVPYAEKPERFAPARPKAAWSPNLLDATKFGPGCVGSRADVPESEDCLSLNLWLPSAPIGGNLPVIVYFHGGMNQHGSGREPLRQGTLIVQSRKFPVIFVNFDWRLGIFGWISAEGVPKNLGLLDQQLALGWVQRHISAFGGDPHRVALMGQSEGAGAILAHLVAPGSRGLFHRCMLHSPVADVWSRAVNSDRTNFMASRLGCGEAKHLAGCLRHIDAQALWSADWVTEEVARNVGSWPWIQNALNAITFMSWKGKTGTFEQVLVEQGWHATVDGDNIPGEPRELIAKGVWHKVPVLLTSSKNESLGAVPKAVFDESRLMRLVAAMLKPGDYPEVSSQYRETLVQGGFDPETQDVLFGMITDKAWMCDIRSLARDMAETGAPASLGVFWHSPGYDPIGKLTNAECETGAACHASEMLYVLPQEAPIGIHGPGMEAEVAYAERVRDDVLAFASGQQGPWAPYAPGQTVTFHDIAGTSAVKGYRKEQCAVLDASASDLFPAFMRAKHRLAS